MPKPKYDKEKVLKWYESLKETFKEADIDINDAHQLSRVKVYYFKEITDPVRPGSQLKCESDEMFAFIPKKFSGQSKDVEGYVEDRPHLPGENAQEDLDELVNLNNYAHDKVLNAMDALTEAYKNLDDNQIINAGVELVEANDESKKTFNDFRNKMNSDFADYYQWMFSAQRGFDSGSEEDYAQIEELYHSAMEGRLFVNPLNSDVESSWQIVVTDDGSKSGISKAGAKDNVPDRGFDNMLQLLKKLKKAGDGASLSDKDRAVREAMKKYEDEHHMAFADMMEVGNPPAAVAKPGTASWLKRFFSFGLADGDFKKYERYQSDLSSYNTQKDQAEKWNRQLYSNVRNFINQYHKEIGVDCPENTLNVADVENNRMRIYSSMIRPGQEEPEKELYTTGTHRMMLRNARVIEEQITKVPESINQDGSFNKDITDEFWDEKGEYMFPVIQAQRASYEKKLNAAKAKYEAFLKLPSEEKEHIRQELEKQKAREAEQKKTAAARKREAAKNAPDTGGKTAPKPVEEAPNPVVNEAVTTPELQQAMDRWSKDAGSFLKKYSKVNVPGVVLLNAAKNKMIPPEEFTKQFSALKAIEPAENASPKTRTFISEYNSLIDGWKKAHPEATAETKQNNKDAKRSQPQIH